MTGWIKKPFAEWFTSFFYSFFLQVLQFFLQFFYGFFFAVFHVFLQFFYEAWLSHGNGR